MKIGIVGGGAIGLLLGYYFSKNHDVTVYTRSAEQAAKISEDGLFLEKKRNQRVSHVKASTFPNDSLMEKELLVIAVKQYQLHQIIPHLSSVDCPLLFVQNGMGHLEYCEKLSINHEVYVGVVEHGALKNGLNSIVHTGDGIVKIASFSGNLTYLQILQQLKEFPVVFEEDYYKMLEKKLIVNTMINPLTAVLQVENGMLIHNPYFLQLFNEYFDELVHILNIENQEEVKRHVREVCENTAENRSSMLRDLEEGRLTEIDAILGYVLQLAKKQNKNAPITNKLYLMVKGKECYKKED